MKPVGEAAVEYFRSGSDRFERFGQFYINRYMPADTAWPELFYETDNAKAILMISNRDLELDNKESGDYV